MRHFICPQLCRYYKPGHSQEEGCGGVLWLERHPPEQARARDIPRDQSPSLFGQDRDHPLLKAICRECPYRAEGCDFRDPAVPEEDCAPCGGLRAVAWLLGRGLIPGEGP